MSSDTINLDLTLLKYIPTIEKPSLKLTFNNKLINTILLSFLYGLLLEIPLIGVKLLMQPINKFSLLMNYEGSILSAGKAVTLWTSLIIQFMVKNGLVDLTGLGRRREENIVFKMTNVLNYLALIINSYTITKEIITNKDKWYIISELRWFKCAIYLQLVIGGMLMILMEQINTSKYVLQQLKYTLLVDSAKVFYNWFKYINRVEYELRFKPIYTVIYSSIFIYLVFFLYSRSVQVPLEYTHVKANYDLKLKFMLGDTQILFVLSTFKEGIFRLLSAISNLLDVNIFKYASFIQVFLSSQDSYYILYINKQNSLLFAEIVYITSVFFLISYIWLVMFNIAGPKQIILEINKAKLKPYGCKADLASVSARLLKPLYMKLMLDSVLLYVLINCFSIFPLFAQSNPASLIVFLTSLMDLIDTYVAEKNKNK